MNTLRKELEAYYDEFRHEKHRNYPADSAQIRKDIIATMDAYLAEHPDEHPSLLKARLHEVMAEEFDPVIFPHTPFFYEMGLRFSENWGCPQFGVGTIGAWLLERKQSIITEMPEYKLIRKFGGCGKDDLASMWIIHSGFDMDHHCLGYTKLLKSGVNGILDEIAARRKQPCTPHQAANLEAMERSCRAVIRVSERFGQKAAAMLQDETDEQARGFLSMVVEASKRVPANPPRTFYEGLAMLWFLREVTATLEAVGISVVGHLDRLLIDLYRADIKAGRLTEEEASDLLARWMLPTDIKFHVDDNKWPETSTCMELGGCDADGRPVWNELTRLIIETHKRHGLINPKPNCRFDKNSPQEYLDLIAGAVLDGHNHFSLLNDGVLIPACMRAGKTEQEARLYVNGGCQETMAEGVEHTAGAFYYFNMPRVLDLALRPLENAEKLGPEDEYLPEVVADSPDFDTFYSRFTEQINKVIHLGASWACKMGKEQWRMHPCPFLSANLEGCIANGMDYTRGGAKYNTSGIAMVGLGTIVDSLYAIKKAVYEAKWVTMDELIGALKTNWEGHEDLRARIRRLPRFGHGNREVDALAAEYAAELADFARSTPSERGGCFQGSFFVYYAFSTFAPFVRATPDGRGDGDLLTQGVAPDRVTAPGSPTDILHTLSHIDFRDFPGNAVLDLQLPAGNAVPLDALSSLFRTFAEMGCPTIQPNCVSLDDLRDAQIHPEKHRDLVVRVSGLSVKFVCLEREVQDEIISRAMVAV